LPFFFAYSFPNRYVAKPRAVYMVVLSFMPKLYPARPPPNHP
jgi:hypothetical protein